MLIPTFIFSNQVTVVSSEVSPTEGTTVSWKTEHESKQDSWSWRNLAWEFGPYPSYEIFLKNGTLVTDVNFIPVGEEFVIVINVEKGIFTGNETLGGAGLNWHIDILNVTNPQGDMLGWADARMGYLNYLVGEKAKYGPPESKNGTFTVWSEFFNRTEQALQRPGVKLGVSQANPGPSPSKSFYIFNRTQSFVNETATQWTIHIVGKFNALITPKGPYNVNLEVYNSHQDMIDFGYVAWSGKTSPWRMIAVGKPGLAYAGYNEFWTFGKYDMKNQTVYSVARGAPWIMRVNVTSSNLVNVTLALDIDDQIRTYFNVTNWHPETRVERGGWQYNSSSGIYFWNATVQIQRTEQVYGPFQQEHWIYIPHAHMVNVTELYWNYTSQRDEWRNYTQKIWGEKMYFIYNHTAKLNNDTDRIFTVKQGYNYWSYDPQLGYSREFQVLRLLNTSDFATRFFSLNLSRCTSYQIGDKWVIDFVGVFNKTTYSSRDQYGINQPTVYCTDGRQIWADWERVNWNEFQVAVDRMVAITKVFDSSGREIKTQMLMTDANKPFTVQSVLQGGEKFFSDIDAVGVRMHAGEGKWAPTESYWSDMEIRLTYNKYENTLSQVTYNRTEKSAYVYGPHMAWVEVNVTGFHNVYNTTLGKWEWVNETYTQWNYTSVTDYHWGYWSLNQTEYARDPSSPKVWIDRADKWISWDDPAFKVPTSYANLNSANISLAEGLVIANLNITFNANAPQTRYWWEVFFGNRTYGIDWTKGWGEHRITEWTKSLVYYANSSGTGGQKWYVDTPSQPYYTWYNNMKYRVYETPYIVIGVDLASGTKYYTKTRTNYEFWSDLEWTDYLFRDQWDPKLQREPRYYELLNGTRLYVNEGYKAIIRDIKLNCIDAYKYVDNQKVYLPNQTIFNTFVDHSKELNYWNGTQQVWLRYYEIINGTRIFKDTSFEKVNWNATTNRWDLNETRYTENATSLLVNYGGRCVFLNGTILVKSSLPDVWQPVLGGTAILVKLGLPDVWQPVLGGTAILVKLGLPDVWQPVLGGTGYYLAMLNGTRIFIENPLCDDAIRIVTIGGKNYTIGWPTNYYTGTYQGRTITVWGEPWNRDSAVRYYYYTTIGSTTYEMPYPGAIANSWWDLENMESSGGKILTGKSVIIGGVKYPIYQDGTRFYIVNGTQRSYVPKPDINLAAWYSLINGNEYWNITQSGWALTYGSWNQRIGRFDVVAGSLTTTTGYDADQRRWIGGNKYGEDRENITRYLVNIADGRRIDVYSGRYLSIWPVTIGGVTYYTMDSWDRSEVVGGVYMSYIRQLNGSKVYFDWGMNPPNWGNEIKIELPGTNYTRLVPYEWQNRTYLDKAYIYNITITNNQGMSWQNGTSVANNTNVKVWGTEYGPGVRVEYGEVGTWIGGLGLGYPDRWPSWSGQELGHDLPADRGRARLETIDGIKIYCNMSWLPGGRDYPFGWDFNNKKWRAEEGHQEDMQWSYINGNQTQGKRLATVVEGGRCIRLLANGTLSWDPSFLEITLGGMWWDEYPNWYVILKNGSRLDFTRGRNIDPFSFQDRSTVIGNQLYWSDQWLEIYYNVTDSGIIYHLYDDHYLAARHYLVPVPKFDDPTKPTIWMNATSDKILRDSSGYFLINASSQTRLNLTSVSTWWNLSEKVRRELFGNAQNSELRYAYPRYNITLAVGGNRTEYYVLDPSPTKGYWFSWASSPAWEDTRYPANFTWEGKSYPINYGEWGGPVRYYDAIVVNGTKYELQESWQWKAVYQAPSLGNAQIQIASENIYKEHTTWGQTYAWTLTDLPVMTVKTVTDIVVGTPKWGMWGVKSFTTVLETGAVDLDGDLTTTNDQYFVRRIHTGSDTSNRTEDRMWVELMWDPNATIPGDEMRIGAWMGKVHNKWTFTWNETYIWYYASNMSTVSSATLNIIKNTLIDVSTGEPKPGYWEISRMAQNTTWEDMKAKAKREGWDWFKDNTNEWEWLWFGARQDYMTNWNSSGVIKVANIGMQYEFAGLLLYNDTNADNIMEQNETTHFFMPKQVGAITFRSPGEDYGNLNTNGTVNLHLNDTVNFGVVFSSVNGTLFPYDPSKPRDMWGWWGGNVFGADYGVPNFNNKPTNSSMNSMKFMIHFNASVARAKNATNHEAIMKIDERFGQWSIDPNIIDGRTKTLTGNVTTYMKGLEILTGRSLAASWYVTAFTNVGWEVKDKYGTRVSATENVTASDTFDVASAATKFATVRMGGTFDWKKPTGTNDTIRTYNITSYTTPLGTFRSSYVSDTGKSSVGFDVTESMYFLTVGFNEWDGYPVYHDPQMSAYIAKFGTSMVPKTPTSISCNLSSTSITKSSSVIVSGTINATVSAPVTIQTSTDGTTWTNLTTVTTSSNGAYSYSWMPTIAGTYSVRASWSGDATHLGATSPIATLTVNELVKKPTKITCELSKDSITKGSSVTISGTINPSVSASVKIQASTDGTTWDDLTTVTTSSNGAYSYTWTPAVKGTYKIRATWAGDATYLGATSPEATLIVIEPQPPPDYTIYIIAIVAILAVAAGSIFILRKSRAVHF